MSKFVNEAEASYIRLNHENKTAIEMAVALRIEELKVRIFCQAEHLTPKPIRKSRKSIDIYHVQKGFNKQYRKAPSTTSPKVDRVPGVYSNLSYINKLLTGQ